MGTSTCTSRKSPPPVRILAWLGLAWLGRDSFNALLKKGTRQDRITRPDHQEGRNDARLPGHDASWTGHYTAQQSTLPNGTQPCNYTCSGRCNTPWTPEQPTALQGVIIIARSRFDTSPSHGNPAFQPQPTSLGKAQ